jgi:CheY-like chemotaxis protein/predicted regulator of Ras-like GTPase activity (Roadblock/LC7/MglB family)
LLSTRLVSLQAEYQILFRWLHMTEQWRILVVEDDDTLNQNIVNTLRKDGYLVQGVKSGAETIRMLWSEEFNVVIGDLKTPGADGFEMLQWLRAYRPNTRMIMVTANTSPTARTQAFEAGVASYLEKPLNPHQLKEELRRLLQQTGFSADLNSFDLLDVIQIINMSRKNIALLVNIGIEEQGILRFQNGELIWAEYGTLYGEEAFFALAAHKNGTVTQQPWHEQITPNVTQPLSRLIFQTLQYRTKYAALQEDTSKQVAIQSSPQTSEIDDTPFVVLAEEAPEGTPTVTRIQEQPEAVNNGHKEWWEQTGKIARIDNLHGKSESPPAPSEATTQPLVNGTNIIPATIHKTPVSQHSDLPSWLTEQPAKSDMSMLHPSSLSNTAQVPLTPPVKPSPAEWQPPQPPPLSHLTQPTQPQTRISGPLARRQPTSSHKSATRNRDTSTRHATSPEWQPPEYSPILPAQSGPLPQPPPAIRTTSGPLINTSKADAQRPRNYPALIAALQTVGYSTKGFIAAAVVSLDGQPIAQVAVDDVDISPMCHHFSQILQGALQSLEQGNWGNHQETLISSATRYILLHLVGTNAEAFQVLITTRDTDPVENLEVMANVEAAIATALH